VNATTRRASAHDRARPPSRLTGVRRRRRRLVVAVCAAFALGVAGVSADARRLLAGEVAPQLIADAASALIATPRFAYEFTGTEELPLQRPVGVCVAGETVFVTDSLAGHVVAFQGTGISARAIGGERLEVPVGIACDEAAEQIIVVDRGIGALMVFAFDGSFVETITPVDAESQPVEWAPVAVAFAEDGSIHVTDTAKTGHRVWHLDRSGEVLGVSPPAAVLPGTPGGFDHPNGIASRDGRTWVADSNSRRLVELDEDGSIVRSIPLGRLIRGVELLPPSEQARRPHFALVDAFSHEVVLVNDIGTELGRIGGPGLGAGGLSFPNDVAVSADALYVADTGNARIQVFEWAPPDARVPLAWPGGPSWYGLIAAPFLLSPIALLALVRTVRVVASREALDRLRDVAQASRGWRPVRLIVTPETADGARRRPGPTAEVSEYSHPDATALDERFELGSELAATLSLARRHRVLLTEHSSLAAVAAASGIDVLDVAGFVEEFAYSAPRPDGDRAVRDPEDADG